MIVVQHQNPNKSISRNGPYFDPLLLVVYLVLVMLGMLSVYSATIANAFDAGDPFIFLRKNGVHVLFALAAMLIVSVIPVRLWEKTAPVLMIVGAILLALVLVPSIGVEINGSHRWLSLGGWDFQPSEFAELAFVLFAADYLSSRHRRLNDLVKDIVPIVSMYLVLACLLILEPDFGSAVVLGAVLVSMLFLSGMRRSHLLLITVAGVLCVAVLVAVEPYRLIRLMSFLSPFSDPYESGFQLTQSLIAFGRGEWFGVGIGNSVQKLFYLPYAGSDFLLAIIAEELGFVGICTVIVLFVTLICRIFHIAWSAGAAGDRFSMILAQGIGMLIAISAFINMGVNMGVLPTKGLTLPFMSEGGTSLIVYSVAIGIIFSIERQSRQEHVE